MKAASRRYASKAGAVKRAGLARENAARRTPAPAPAACAECGGTHRPAPAPAAPTARADAQRAIVKLAQVIVASSCPIVHGPHRGAVAVIAEDVAELRRLVGVLAR